MKKAQLPLATAEVSLDLIKEFILPLAPRKFLGTKNPRYLRVIAALQRGPLTCKELEQVAEVSNGPALVAELRRLGFCLPFCRFYRPTANGGCALAGLYVLTVHDQLIYLEQAVAAMVQK